MAEGQHRQGGDIASSLLMAVTERELEEATMMKGGGHQIVLWSWGAVASTALLLLLLSRQDDDRRHEGNEDNNWIRHVHSILRLRRLRRATARWCTMLIGREDSGMLSSDKNNDNDNNNKTIFASHNDTNMNNARGHVGGAAGK
jgi:hypothetical protein